MKKITAVMFTLVAFALGANFAQAQMMSGMMEPGKGMMEEHLPGMMNSELTMLCRADLNDLGLSPDVVKSLEEKRFDVHIKAIRLGADLKILKLEIAKLMESRTFDFKAVEEKADGIGQKETELRKAHLKFLHDIGAALSDDQWERLRQESNKMMSGGMMPMMGAMMGHGKTQVMTGGMMPMMGGMTSQGKTPAMTGGMMQGDGMMMNQGGTGGSGKQNANHSGRVDEAEKFFQEEK